jgi:hypothetical protein
MGKEQHDDDVFTTPVKTKGDGHLSDSTKNTTSINAEAKPEEPPVPRKSHCCWCLTYDRASLLIGVLDCIVFVTIIALVAKLKSVTSNYELTDGFSKVLFSFPITGLVIVFAPRVIALMLAYCFRTNIKYRRIHSVVRSITSVIMFGLCMT